MNQTTPPPNPNDDELMARLATDDAAALEELMSRWQGRIFTFAWRGVRQREAAEEIAQETFWRIWRGRRDYLPEGRFATWIFRIASRLCLDHYRRAGRRPVLLGEAAAAVDATPAPQRADSAAREAELAEALDLALARLPVNQRLALEMQNFQSLSYREIADALGCSVGAVEQLIFRARQRLRVELADFLPGDTSKSTRPS